jgi:hypothetical protein
MTSARNSRIWRAIPLLITIFSLSFSAQAQYGGGRGEPNDPYLIYTAEQMNAIGSEPNDWSRHFKLMADIDLSSYTGTDFNIIGNEWTNPFAGVFDGNGYRISHFNYTSIYINNIGLFGYIRGVIKGLGLIEPNVDAGSVNNVGSLACCLNEGTITGCYVEGGSVSGNWDVGGLVGSNYGTIADCHSTASVMGTNGAGGLVGWNYEGKISDCYSSSNVQGRLESSHLGGLVGGNGSHSGGSTIINCYSCGDVSGETYLGGLAGGNCGSFPFGMARIINCYSAGTVMGIKFLGGLVGRNSEDASIINCYATGRVSGTTDAGGLVGENKFSPGTITASLWDIETSGRSNMCGAEVPGGSGCDDSYGKITTEMQSANTFINAGWDFLYETENGTEDVWWILEGQSYPRLWWQYGLAFSPYPQDSAIDVIQPVILNWLPGGSGLYHNVYLGEDKESVADATIESPDIYHGQLPVEITTFDPGKLALDTTYYWRIDEVNDDINSSWKGDVWSFTTADFLIVDDFESYHDLDLSIPPSHRIYKTWIDGLGTTTTRTNGSQVGYLEPPFAELTIIHGGKQSMPFFYDNSGPANYSEALAHIVNLPIDHDWTIEGVGVLSLWFYSNESNATERMYVALNGSAIIYYTNPEAVLIEEWTEWTMDLQEFADQGMDLTKVDTISIGFGNRNNPQTGGSGLVFFDDIRLYRPVPQ